MQNDARHMLIYVLGDIHGQFGALNDFINKKIRTNATLRTLAAELRGKGGELEVLLLQVGDFGFFWPGEDNTSAIKNAVDFLPGGRVKIYFCAGNHENHDALDALFPQPAGSEHGPHMAEVAPGVYFARFGAVLPLADGTNVLFAGGAESCDKAYRTPGLSWWPQEGIDAEDMARLEGIERVDWVISHTAPTHFLLSGYFYTYKRHEPSRRRLDTILERFSPTRWFFGHFHESMHGEACGCNYVCLNYPGSEQTWFTAVEIRGKG